MLAGSICLRLLKSLSSLIVALKPFLSLIIPAYNEERRLPQTLEQVFAFLEKQTYSFEVLVVENGSNDHTLQVAQTFAKGHPALRPIQQTERGKGGAVLRGIREAHGEYLFICDADLSMPIVEINKFLPPTLSQADIAIGSREAPGAVRYNEPMYRHLTGRVFNMLIRAMVLPRLQDTQCGFKCMRADVAREICRYQTLSGWAFDVELLYIAHRLGYQIVEIPIHWYFNADSKVRILRDAWRMFVDLLVIRRNAWQGRYERRP